MESCEQGNTVIHKKDMLLWWDKAGYHFFCKYTGMKLQYNIYKNLPCPKQTEFRPHLHTLVFHNPF